MEPEVHIIEKYFQELEHCFTMTNIRCKGGKEIDLLAINPVTGKKYHVESRVSTTHPLRLKATYTKKGCHKDGVDYFAQEKFGHKVIVEKIKELFGDTKYAKILVVYSIYTGGLDEHVVLEPAFENYGITILYIMDIIEYLKKHGTMKGSRDDVLRLVELISISEKEDENIRRRTIEDIRRSARKTVTG